MDSSYLYQYIVDEVNPEYPCRVVVECDGEFYETTELTIDSDGDLIIKTGGPL